mgnify:CR=1 FL=1
MSLELVPLFTCTVTLAAPIPVSSSLMVGEVTAAVIDGERVKGTLKGNRSPAKLAVYAPQVSAPLPVVDGLKPMFELLQLNDAGVRGVVQDWLQGVYVAADVTTAFMERSKHTLADAEGCGGVAGGDS